MNKGRTGGIFRVRAVFLRHIASAACIIGAMHSSAVAGAVPSLYSNRDRESPVRGEPDDLLILVGAGLSADDKVVYRALADTNASLSPPAGPILDSDSVRGTAPVVDRSNVPAALTVRLPANLSSGTSYGLWVHARNG
jgi:hypothetical protein